MKFVEVVRPGTTEPMFGQPRRMGFGYGDIRRISKNFKAPLVGDEATWNQSLLGRMSNLDPEVISSMLLVALSNFTKKNLTLDDVEELIEGYLEGDEEANPPVPPGSLNDIVSLIRSALEAGSYVKKRETNPNAVDADDDKKGEKRRPLETV